MWCDVNVKCGDGPECTLSKLADGTKLGWWMSPDPSMQNDLYKMENWAEMTSWSSAKANSKFCTSGGIIVGNGMCWALTTMNAALLKRPQGSRWMSWMWANSVPLWQRRPTASWAAWGGVLLAGRRKSSSPFHLRCILGPVLGSPVQDRHGLNVASLAKGRGDG